MPTDNYEYPIVPLPPLAPWGGDSLTNGMIPFGGFGNTDVPFPTASAVQANGPFGEPSVDGGGSGTPPPLTCADSITVGDIQTNQVGFPCTGSPVAVIDRSNLTQDDGAGGTAQLSAATGIFNLTNTDGEFDLQTSEINGGSGTIQLQELDVCHMGSAGFRQFVAGNAYA